MKRFIEQDGFPRLHMMMIVILTGAIGFIASFCMLKLGMTDMAVRYFLACAIAYLGFLGLLWLWLRTGADYYDAPDLLSPLPHNGAPCYDGGGGEFAGGGASGSFDDSYATTNVLPESASDALSSVGDADEFGIPLLIIVLIGAALLSSVWIIYTAPLLFAELVVDGVLAASLYRRLRGLDSPHWLQTAVRHSALPFLTTALIAAASGWGMQHYAPEAESIGHVFEHRAR